MNVANQGVSFCHPIPTIRGRSSVLRTLGVSLLPQGITHHPPLGDSVTLRDTPLLKQSLPGPGKATAGLISPLPPLPTAPRLLTEDCAHPIPTEAAVRSLTWQNFTAVQGHLSRAYLVFLIRSLQYNHSSHIRMRTATPFPVSKAFRICSMVLWSIFAHLFNIILSLKNLPPSTILVLYTSCAGKGKGKKSFHSQTHTSCAPSCVPAACISRLGLLWHKPGGLHNRNVLFCSILEVTKSKIKVSAGSVLPRAVSQGSVPGPSPWPTDGHLLPVSVHIACPLCVSVSGSKCPPFVRIPVILD